MDSIPLPNMPFKSDDAASQPKLLIKSEKETEEFEKMKQAQESLKQEIDFVKKTIKGDTSNMLRLVEDLNDVYKKLHNNESYSGMVKANGAVDYNLDQKMREDHDLLKRKVELINSKEHSLSQRLMNVEDRVLIALDKKSPSALRHQGVEKREFLMLQAAVNELQETCRYEPSNKDTNNPMHETEIITLKRNQKQIEKELIELKTLVKNETANTFEILSDMNSKIDHKDRLSQDRKDSTFNSTQNSIPSTLAGYHVEPTRIDKDLRKECMERIDRIVLDQNSLNDSLRQQVDALWKKEQKTFDRLSGIENKVEDRYLRNNKWEDRLNHIDEFLLKLTRSVNDVVIKISNKQDYDNEKKEQDKLSELRSSLRNVLSTLNDFNKGLKNEKVDIEMLKQKISSLENYMSKNNADQKPEQLKHDIEGIKSELNSLSRALNDLNTSKLIPKENKEAIENANNEIGQNESQRNNTNRLQLESSTLVRNITDLSQKVENLITAIDELKRNSKIETDRGDKYQTIIPYTVPSTERNKDRNFYIHEGHDVNGNRNRNDDTLQFQLIDEEKRNLMQDFNGSLNEKRQGVSLKFCSLK